jgi:hypothetical protein
LPTALIVCAAHDAEAREPVDACVVNLAEPWAREADRRLRGDPVPLSSRGVLVAASDGGGAAEADVAQSLRALRDALLRFIPYTEPANALRAATEYAVRAGGDEVAMIAVLLRGPDAYACRVGSAEGHLFRDGELFALAVRRTMPRFVLRPPRQVIEGRLTLRRGDRVLLCAGALSSRVGATDICGALGSPSLDEGRRVLSRTAEQQGYGQRLVAAELARPAAAEGEAST